MEDEERSSFPRVRALARKAIWNWQLHAWRRLYDTGKSCLIKKRNTKIHCCNAVPLTYKHCSSKTDFNRYLSLEISNQKVKESGLAFFWPNWSRSDLPNPNTNTQIHKHTNTQIHKYSILQSARKTHHVVYFWKEDCSRMSKMIFPCVKSANTKIQIQKYTNTQTMACARKVHACMHA